MAEENCTCVKCGKSMDPAQFYTYKDGRKTEMCKKCLTMHIDNFDPNTFLWLLEKMDVPYLPEEWNVLRDRAYAKNPNKMNGMSVFGKYLSKMKLRQWKDYGWADGERLREQYEERTRKIKEEKEAYEEEIKQQYEEGKITEAQYKTLVSTETQHAEEPMYGPPPDMTDNPYNEQNFISEDEMIDPAAELTKDDKIYLAMKWGRLYKPSEWVELEQKYNEMMNSFDIQDSDTTGTLILICKTYLKMNQAIDCGDVSGYNTLSRVYDTLRKSAKFTAAQNKDAKNNYVDSVGELVAMCEREGFIPRYVTDIPQDKVDITLKDMNNYVRKLVTQDLGFGQQIEDSIKKLQVQKEIREQEDNFDFDEEDQGLRDEDFEEYFEEIEEQKQQDMKIMNGVEENG